MLKILERNKITNKLIASFVDNIRFILRALRREVMYNKVTKEVYWDREQEEKDNSEDASGTEVTRRVLHEILNSTSRGHLSFTIETRRCSQTRDSPH